MQTVAAVFRYLVAVLTMVVVVAPPAHAGSRSKTSGTFYGPGQTVGAGTARPYLIAQEGMPVEVGFELSEDALRALPAGEKWQPRQHRVSLGGFTYRDCDRAESKTASASRKAKASNTLIVLGINTRNDAKGRHLRWRLE